MKCLLVDDQWILRRMLKALLQLHFHATYTEAGSGSAAIQLLKGENFDLIISDQWMAEGTGTDIADFLERRQCKTPFILFTSDTENRFPGVVRKDDSAGLLRAIENAGFLQKRELYEKYQPSEERPLSIPQTNPPSARPESPRH